MEITKQCLGVGYDEKILEGLKVSTFTTTLKLVPHRGQTVEPVKVLVDHKAAVRQSIIVALRRAGVTFKTRSDWHAKDGIPSRTDGTDWDYPYIAVHHAGNSFSCAQSATTKLRAAEKLDIEKFGHISYHYIIDCDGTIYEGQDIRLKGAGIDNGNSGVIDIVLLEDLSVRGEAYKQEYQQASMLYKIKGILGIAKDQMDTLNDEPTGVQIRAFYSLVDVLQKYFPIAALGGHREYQKISTKMGRACPGMHGMIVVNMARKKFGLPPPPLDYKEKMAVRPKP